MPEFPREELTVSILLGDKNDFEFIDPLCYGNFIINRTQIESVIKGDDLKSLILIFRKHEDPKPQEDEAS